MITFRPYRSDDLDSLYAISLATGHQGGDAAHLYQDGRLIGHIYSAPYAILNPQLAFVAAEGDAVRGFVVGAVDTVAWESILERDWWPPLRLRYPDPGPDPSETWTADQRRAFMIHHPRSTPPAVTDAFPAHLHLNLLPGYQGRGVGSALLRTWLNRATELGASGFHVGVNSANLRALLFLGRRGFRNLNAGGGSQTGTIWLGRSHR